MEGAALHLAGNGNDDVGNALFFCNFQQVVALAENWVFLHLLAKFLRVIVNETDKEERRRPEVFIGFSQPLSGLPSTYDQHAAHKGGRGENANVDKSPEQGQARGRNEKNSNANPVQ